MCPPPPRGEVDPFERSENGSGGGLQEQLRAFSRLPPPEKFCAALEFFGLPTRGRRAREVKLAPMRERWRLEKLRGPPEFTLRRAFAGPAARAMTIFDWNVVRATADFPRTALRYSEKVSTFSLWRYLGFAQ